MEFQSNKTKIGAHSIFSIEEVQKILREPMRTLGAQLIYKTIVAKNYY